MRQINFRVSDDEYTFAENLARILGKTVPVVVKEFGYKAMHHASIDLALDLYKNNKVGLKTAWIMTGLAFHEFTAILMARNIDPPCDPARVDRAIEDAKATRFEDLFPGKSKDEVQRLIKVPGD